MYNKVILGGYVGKDPEVRTVNETKVTQFSLATTEVYRDENGDKQEVTYWHNLVAWGKIAETIEKCVKKGTGILIDGKITNRSYDGKDGEKKYITEIRVLDMKFLPSGNKGDKQTPLPPMPGDLHDQGDDDQLPF